MRGASLTINNLTKRFGGVVAVDNLSGEIKEGATVGVIGPNGAGKSTLLALLSGLAQPDEGEILLDGHALNGKKAHEFAQQGVRRTFQDARLIPQAPVANHLELVAPYEPWPTLFSSFFVSKKLQHTRSFFESRALSKLKEINLDGVWSRKGENLSYGQSKLVELVRADLAEGRMLLLDEPFSGLSPAMVEIMTDLIRSLAQAGRTILLVEHNLSLIKNLCDRVLVMAAGQRLDFDTFENVSRNPAVIDAYLGH